MKESILKWRERVLLCDTRKNQRFGCLFSVSDDTTVLAYVEINMKSH